MHLYNVSVCNVLDQISLYQSLIKVNVLAKIAHITLVYTMPLLFGLYAILGFD